MIAIGAVGIGLSIGAAWAWSQRKRDMAELEPQGILSKSTNSSRRRRGKRHKLRNAPTTLQEVHDSDSSEGGGSAQQATLASAAASSEWAGDVPTGRAGSAVSQSSPTPRSDTSHPVAVVVNHAECERECESTGAGDEGAHADVEQEADSDSAEVHASDASFVPASTPLVTSMQERPVTSAENQESADDGGWIAVGRRQRRSRRPLEVAQTEPPRTDDTAAPCVRSKEPETLAQAPASAPVAAPLMPNLAESAAATEAASQSAEDGVISSSRPKKKKVKRPKPVIQATEAQASSDAMSTQAATLAKEEAAAAATAEAAKLEAADDAALEKALADSVVDMGANNPLPCDAGASSVIDENVSSGGGGWVQVRQKRRGKREPRASE